MLFMICILSIMAIIAIVKELLIGLGCSDLMDGNRDYLERKILNNEASKKMIWKYTFSHWTQLILKWNWYVLVCALIIVFPYPLSWFGGILLILHVIGLNVNNNTLKQLISFVSFLMICHVLMYLSSFY